MIHLSTTILLAAKPALVWRCLVDETMLTKWVEGLVNVDRVVAAGGEAPPQFDFSVTVARQRLRGTSEVTAQRDEELYALETRIGKTWLLFDTIRLAAEHPGTRLDVASELHRLDSGALVEFFARPTGLLGGASEHPLEGAYVRSFDSFKKLVEMQAERPYR